MPTIDLAAKGALVGKTVVWDGLATGDEGSAYATEGNELVVQVEATFGGATCTMQGSNDGTNWYALNDKAVPANPCSFAVAGLKGILQVPKYIRPSVAAGAGTDFVITLYNAK